MHSAARSTSRGCSSTRASTASWPSTATTATRSGTRGWSGSRASPRRRWSADSAFDVFPFLKEIGEDRYFDEALAGRDATSTERRYEVPDSGAEGYFEARYSPLHGTDGDVIGGLAIISEITDRKQVEQEREQRQREEVARAAAEARNRMVENLQAVTDTALGHLSLDAMATELLDRTRTMLGTDIAALALVEENGETLVIRAATGFETEVARGPSDPVRQRPAGPRRGRARADRRGRAHADGHPCARAPERGRPIRTCGTDAGRRQADRRDRTSVGASRTASRGRTSAGFNSSPTAWPWRSSRPTPTSASTASPRPCSAACFPSGCRSCRGSRSRRGTWPVAPGPWVATGTT